MKPHVRCHGPRVRRFAEQIERLAREPLPEEVAEHARLSLFNVLGTSVGAAGHPGVDKIVALGERSGGPPVASAPGRSEPLDAHHVALATAFAAHVDDFDDTHLATVIHPGAACPGVLCGLAGTERDGAQALRAFAAGCEAQLRLGLAVTPWHYDRGWHITGTCGPVGACVTAMTLLGVAAVRWEDGIGHALQATLGMREGFGTMCKAWHPARAAANGIFAARLAAAGVDGPRGSLPDGAWVEALSGHFLVDELTGAPGRWRLLDNTFKPYPCGIVSHPAIEAGERLAARLRGSPIESVELRCHPLVPELTGNPQPRDGLEARFSTIHGVCAALLDGEVTLAQYADERVVEPGIVDLRDLTSLHPDPECPRDAAELRVVVAGKELVSTVEHARGSLGRPAGLGRPAREDGQARRHGGRRSARAGGRRARCGAVVRGGRRCGAACLARGRGRGAGAAGRGRAGHARAGHVRGRGAGRGRCAAGHRRDVRPRRGRAGGSPGSTATRRPRPICAPSARTSPRSSPRRAPWAATTRAPPRRSASRSSGAWPPRSSRSSDRGCARAPPGCWAPPPPPHARVASPRQ